MCTVTEYDQTEAWPDALTQGSAIDAPINRMYRGSICEKAAENGVLSATPQTRGPRRFKLVSASCAKLGRF